MNNFKYFTQLHKQIDPLLIANVWNVQSARVFEKQKFQALATSSAAVAETLGYADGEEMSFEEYLFIIDRIRKSVNLPLSVDLEAGYGKTVDEIVANIKLLCNIGVVGINIEDSTIENGTRRIVDEQIFAEKLRQICAELNSQNIKIFINVRCDVYILSLPNSVNESIRRITLYQDVGAQGLFLPCITDLEEIKTIVASTDLPLNVMCMPNLPSFDLLKKAGVKRISMGNFFNKVSDLNLEKMILKVTTEGSFSPLF